MPEFPGFFEVGWGINNFIVPRQLNGDSYKRGVIRIGGYLPFKIGPLQIYFYGNAIVQLRKESKYDTTDPIVMNPIFENIDFAGENSAEVVQLPVKIEARDFFRVGIGVDLTKVVGELFSKKRKEEE